MKLEINIPDIKKLKKYPKDYYFSGIYILWNKEKLVYVGQSRNLYYRLAAHKSQFKDKWDFYSFFQESNYVIRVAIEAYLINHFKPPLNKHVNGVHKTISKNAGKKSKKYGKKRKRIAKELYEKDNKNITEIVQILKIKYGILTTRQTLHADKLKNWE